jgi:hypothetical protein
VKLHNETKSPAICGAFLMSRDGLEPSTIGLKGQICLQSDYFCDFGCEKSLQIGLVPIRG